MARMGASPASNPPPPNTTLTPDHSPILENYNLLRNIQLFREAAKKGGGVKGRAIKEKITFSKNFFPTFRNFNGH